MRGLSWALLFSSLSPSFSVGLKMFTPYVFAGVVILVIFFMPQGFVGLYQKAAMRFMKSGDWRWE